MKGKTEILHNFFEMFPRHNILGKAKAQEGLETKHYDFAFKLFTEEMKGPDNNLHMVLHPKENLYIFLLYLFTESFHANESLFFFNALEVF